MRKVKKVIESLILESVYVFDDDLKSVYGGVPTLSIEICSKLIAELTRTMKNLKYLPSSSTPDESEVDIVWIDSDSGTIHINLLTENYTVVGMSSPSDDVDLSVKKNDSIVISSISDSSSDLTPESIDEFVSTSVNRIAKL